MAGGLLLSPSYTQDQLYPAYQDRLLMKSMGVQAGVVGENDFKVTAGSGLQVEVEKGKSLVEQTGATQESSNTFYNGLYNVLGPVKQNPYNSAEVPTTAPQIAQIILRVYDISELGIGGSSYGRIEWLNGIPNTLASKTVIEEGKASVFGAVALPASSYRCAYVLVPKNATKSSEFIIVDARTFSSVSPWVSLSLGGKMQHVGSLEFPSIRTEMNGYSGRLRGSIEVKNGSTLSSGETIFTLPYKYRPLVQTRIGLFGNSITKALLIEPTGICSLTSALAEEITLYLSGATFELI